MPTVLGLLSSTGARLFICLAPCRCLLEATYPPENTCGGLNSPINQSVSFKCMTVSSIYKLLFRKFHGKTLNFSEPHLHFQADKPISPRCEVALKSSAEACPTAASCAPRPWATSLLIAMALRLGAPLALCGARSSSGLIWGV